MCFGKIWLRLLPGWLAGEADTGVCGRQWETWGVESELVADDSSSLSSGSSSPPRHIADDSCGPPANLCKAAAAALGGAQEASSAGLRPEKKARLDAPPELEPGHGSGAERDAAGGGLSGLRLRTAAAVLADSQVEQVVILAQERGGIRGLVLQSADLPRQAAPYSAEGFERVELRELSQLQVLLLACHCMSSLFRLLGYSSPSARPGCCEAREDSSQFMGKLASMWFTRPSLTMATPLYPSPPLSSPLARTLVLRFTLQLCKTDEPWSSARRSCTVSFVRKPAL